MAAINQTVNSAQIKITKMLLVVSTSFICLNLPGYLMRIRDILSNVSLSLTNFIAMFIKCHFRIQKILLRG